jgi:hypothetical protein
MCAPRALLERSLGFGVEFGWFIRACLAALSRLMDVAFDTGVTHGEG